MEKDIDFAFIIPAFDEQDNIQHAIDSIHNFVPDCYTYEVIVVDHGSKDHTVKMARERGAAVFTRSYGTIAGLRNFGVENSTGEVLIFLDADIRLTEQWKNEIISVINSLRSHEKILTGSWYSIPDDPNWIEKYWFKPLESGSNSHINSGHLIISRTSFNEINGFDESLETGEDYDISMRAKKAGFQIVDNLKLRVIHEGYPKSLLEFIKREYWHGKGDAQSLDLLFKSKIAVLALIFFITHIVVIYQYCCGDGTYSSLNFLLFVSIPIFMSIYKFSKHNIVVIVVSTLIYYFYFWARVFSILTLPGIRAQKKRSR